VGIRVKEQKVEVGKQLVATLCTSKRALPCIRVGWIGTSRPVKKFKENVEQINSSALHDKFNHITSGLFR
jgi:hypothetical protein